MKRNHKQMWRTVIALVLTFTLVFGTASTAFATMNTGDVPTTPVSVDVNGNGEVDYVALGDSMTNGYGLESYYPEGINGIEGNHYFGYMMNAAGTYPTIVAEEYGWNLKNLAISGMRPAELRYLLDYKRGENKEGEYPGYKGDQYTSYIWSGLDDYDNDGVIRPEDLREYWTCNKGHAIPTVEEDGNNVNCGVEGCQHMSSWGGGPYPGFFEFETFMPKYSQARFASAYWGSNGRDGWNHSEWSVKTVWDNHAGDGAWFNGDKEKYFDGTLEGIGHPYIGTQFVRAEYKKYLTEADVISVHMGTNNFGTVVQKKLFDILDGVESGRDHYDVTTKDLLTTEEEKAQFDELYNEVKATFEKILPQEYVHLATEMTDAVTYSMLQFVNDYEVSMDIIREMNPDAKLVLVGLTTTMENVTVDAGNDIVIDMGEIMGAMPLFANVFMACKYAEDSDVTFVNVDELHTLIDELGTGNGNDVYRFKLVHDMIAMVRDALSVEDSVYQEVYNAVNNGPAKMALVKCTYEDQRAAAEQGLIDAIRNAKGNAVADASDEFIEFVVELYNLAVEGASHTNLSVATLGDVFEGGTNTSTNILTDAVKEKLKNDTEYSDTVKSMMHLYARLKAAEGIGIHPSEQGHAQIADTFMNALETNYTSKDYLKDEAINTAKKVADLVVEYYDDAYAYAYQYAKEEGYIDATIDGIHEVEKALEAALNEAKATGMSDELKAELEAAYEGALETTAQLEKLILEADVLDDATYAEAMALLAKLEGNLNDFCSVAEQVGVDTVKQLKKAYEYLKPIVVEKLKEAVKAGAEWLLNKLVEALPEIDKALYDWLYENPETVIGFFVEYNEEIAAITEKYGDEAVAVLLYALSTYGPAAVEWAIENPEEAIAKWVKWYNKHGHKVWPMIDKYLKTMDEMGMFDEIKQAISDAAAELEAYVIAYAEKVVAELEAMIEELDAAAKAALEELKAAIEAVDVDAILAALEELYNEGVAIWDGATSGYYAATEDSYYVALGDTNVEYAEIVAEELDLEKDQFVNYGIEEMTAAELKAYLNAGDEDLIAEIEKADLITLGFSNNTVTKFAADTLAAVMAGEEVDFDWAPYVGKDGAAAMDKAVAAIEEALVAEGADAATIDMVATVVEAYAFACTEFACNYPEAINAIKAINPEAQVVVVGMYNPFEGAVVEFEGTQIPVGDYVGMLVDLANVHYTSYALLTGNAVYVHAPAVEIQAPFEEAMDITGFAAVLTDLDSLEPSAAGHEYIAQQILDAMNVVSKAVYDAQKLIEEIAAFGDVTRENLEDAKALAEAARAAWDALSDEEKELIGLENYKALVDFELAVAKVELGVAEDIAAAEKALAEAEAKAAEIERALKITDSTVTALKAKVVNKSQIKVTWKAPETTPDQYRVALIRDGKKVGTYWVAGDKETVTLKNLLRGTNFTVRVTPVAKVDGKKYFSIYKTSNKVKTQLQKANLAVKKAGLKKQIMSKDQNSTGFQIYISQDKKFKKNVKKLVYQTNKKGLNVKVKAKNFKKGTNYVKVRAYTKVNGKTVYGAWSGTVKVVK